MVNTGPKRWTKNELILALNLYCKLPFGKMHKGNPSIIALASYLGRTPSSVAMKLVNFAALDPSLPRKGLSGTSRLDQEVWDEFFDKEDIIEKGMPELEDYIINIQDDKRESSVLQVPR